MDLTRPHGLHEGISLKVRRARGTTHEKKDMASAHGQQGPWFPVSPHSSVLARAVLEKPRAEAG